MGCENEIAIEVENTELKFLSVKIPEKKMDIWDSVLFPFVGAGKDKQFLYQRTAWDGFARDMDFIGFSHLSGYVWFVLKIQ